jgi:aspartate aminotransferase
MGKLSKRIENLTESQTIAMARMSRELKAKGVDVISLSLGEPDFITPEIIRDGAKAAMDAGYTHYPPIAGYTDLRETIVEKFKTENNLDFAVENIVVSTGAKQSIANVLLSTIDPGDEILVPIPYWVSYTQVISLCEGVPVFIDSGVENDYKITAEQLQQAITPKTKMMIFSSPCNPSGSVYTKEELHAFADVLAPYEDIIILSDEIYEHINFGGEHESISQFENVRDRVVIVNGVSKAYAMTGWRIGYIGAPKWIASACNKMQGQITSAASSIAQKAAITALQSGGEFHKAKKEVYLKRRDLMLNLLKDIPGMKLNIPQGAFYIFPDISSYFGKKYNDIEITDSTSLCMYILKEGNVGLVPGEAFGKPECIRISYATSNEQLTEAAKRIKDCLSKLT